MKKLEKQSSAALQASERQSAPDINAHRGFLGRPRGLFSLQYSIAASLLLVTTCSISAEQIYLGDFSQSAKVINFDDLTGGTMNGAGTVVTDQYSALGVTFNDHELTATANAFLTSYIPGSSAPNVLFVDQGYGTGSFPPLEINFTIPVNKVGALFGSSANSTITMDAYNGNVLLESLTMAGNPASIGLSGFVGLEESQNITSVTMSYHPNFAPATSFNFSIDNLTFESTVPEPGSWALLLLGSGLMGVLNSRRKTGSDNRRTRWVCERGNK